MNDITCRDYFQQNFVIAHVTVYETGDKQKLNNAGGEMILKNTMQINKVYLHGLF